MGFTPEEVAEYFRKMYPQLVKADPTLPEKLKTGAETTEGAAFVAAIAGTGFLTDGPKGALQATLATAGMVTFTEFILEEAMQTAMFPVSMLIRANLKEAAEAQLNIVEKILIFSETFVNTLGVANPISLMPFRVNNEAVRTSMNMYRQLIRAQPITAAAAAKETAAKVVLEIDSTPTRAALYIDGKYTNHLTPETMSIDKGRHDVKVVKKGYRDGIKTVEVQEGTTSIFFDMEAGTAQAQQAAVSPAAAAAPIAEEKIQMTQATSAGAPPSSVTSENDLADFYFKPLFSQRKNTYFQFRGTFTATPFVVTVVTYQNADSVTGRSSRYPTTTVERQNPNDWLPAFLVQ